MLHNARPPIVPPGEVARILAGLFLQDTLQARAALRIDPSVSPASFDDYVGRYRIDSGRVQIVSREGDQLYSQITRQARYPLFPSAPDRFFFKVVDAQIQFVRDDSGNVMAAHHDQGGGKRIAARIDDPKEVALAPAELRDFAGRYDYRGTLMTIRLEEGRLRAQLTGQPESPIYPVGEDVFVWKIVEARITFVRDDRGLVTHAVHDQNGAVFEVAKLD
jgi:hypothetical protein